MTDTGRGSDPEAGDIRPVVGLPTSNRIVWMFAIGMAVAGSALFYGLEQRREQFTESGPPVSGPESGMITAPLDLRLPDNLDVQDNFGAPLYPRPVSPIVAEPVPRAAPQSVRRRSPVVGTQPWDETSASYAPAGPAVASVEERPRAAADASFGFDTERVRATRFANPSTTVPKGTLIQAVLETALDSTRPGFARGVVSRDVYSFDGNKVLIPRGSRLIGEYKADLSPGQNRALILWQRLMRPDGVLINLESPAADPLGRAGVGGKVNSHFFERFGGAILQSALDIGVQLATRQVSKDTVIVALPGSAQNVVSERTEAIRPTLKVRQGASVSVFVARDLDFTSADQ